MARIIPYFTFNGNCRQAMTFYQECLGGELYLQTVRHSPMASQMPEKMKNCVLHASLRKRGLTLMATDMVGDQGLIRGNTISVLLTCSSEQEIRHYYDSLSVGGRMDHPIERTFLGALFGELTDRYGNHWMLSLKTCPDLVAFK